MKYILLFLVFFILIAGCAQDTPLEPDSPGSLGQATTEWFAISDEYEITPSIMSLSVGDTGVVTLEVESDFVYKIGYYWNGEEWTEFTLEGTQIGRTDWLASYASKEFTVSLDTHLVGDNYYITFACNAQGTEFVCNEQKWLLDSFELSKAADPQPQDTTTEFAQTPAEYAIGSGQDLQLTIGNDIAGVDYVIFQAWHNDLNQVQAEVVDSQAPFTYTSENLDAVDAGSVRVQALVKHNDEFVARVGFDTVFVKPASDQPKDLPEPTQSLSVLYFTGIQGNSVAELTAHPSYPSNPTERTTITSFDLPRNYADQYGVRVLGYIYPPVTGDYKFWVASDDSSVVRLSTDESFQNRVKIASVNGYTSYQQWDKFSTQSSEPIRLEAGKRYIIDVLATDVGGNDHLSVAWEYPGQSRTIIDGAYLSAYYAEQEEEEQQAVCGNNIVEQGEVCDGNTKTCSLNGQTGTQSCNSQCTGHQTCQVTQANPVCGNNIIETGEQCDDGNKINGDGCSASCTYESSSNQCNDGIDNDGDGLVDWQYDLGCYGPGDTTEGGKHFVKENGWTVFEPQSDTTIYYVSSSDGNDNNNGLSPQTPFKTQGKAISKLRDGSSDWILFKRGDTFYGGFGKAFAQGKSATQPILFGTYGDSIIRPEFKIGSSDKVYTDGNKQWKNMVFLGLHLHQSRRNPFSSDFVYSDAVNAGNEAFDYNGQTGAENIHFEDNKIQGFTVVWSLEIWRGYSSTHNNFVLHRNVLTDNYEATDINDIDASRSFTVWHRRVKDFVASENMVDVCGWHPHPKLQGNAQPSILAHCFYLSNAQWNDNIQEGGYPSYLEGNIIARAASHAIQMRASGSVINNLLVENNGAYIDGFVEPGTEAKKIAKNNVITEVSNKPLRTQSGTGGNAGKGLHIYGRISEGSSADMRACSNIGTRFFGEQRGGAGALSFSVPSSVASNNIVYNWDGEQDLRDGQSFNPNSVPDAEVSVTRYLQSIGMNPSLDTLYAKMREQSKYTWDDRITADAINDYFRAGFGIGKC